MPKASLQRWYEWFTALLVFLVPSNLFLKFFEESAYVNGLLVDYLLPKLYVSDLVVLVLFGLWLFNEFKFNTNKILHYTWFLGLSLLFITRQFFSEYPFASLWFLFKLLEMGWLGYFFWTHQNIFKSKLIHWTLLLTLCYQSLLAAFQFLTQHSLIGYYFLGEPNLSNYLGLAKGVFNGAEKTLPYGTTAHPNILGGFLAIGLLLVYTLRNTFKNQWFFFLTCLGISSVLFLTQSVSAWLSLLVGILIIELLPIFTNKSLNKGLLVAGLLVLLTTPVLVHHFAHQSTDQSLLRRDFLNQAAVQMFIDRPFIGVGLNNFTAKVEEYSQSPEVVRFVQPVHHVGLLWLSETGLLGVGVLAAIVLIIRQRHLKWLAFTVMVPIFSLDHYLLTHQTGLLLFVFLWGISTNYLRQSLPTQKQPDQQ